MFMFDDLTILVCNYNTPLHIETLLKSFVKFHGDGPHKILIAENSTNEDSVNLLDKNNIKYIRNVGGTHSPSVDILLDRCTTKYALLVDSDIVFLRSIDNVFKVMKENDGVLLGEVAGDRGGYRIFSRIHPWYCFINVEEIKKHNIKWHDQKRIDETNSGYFFKNVPINPHVNNKYPFYDNGSTFFADINAAGLKIIDTGKSINNYFFHHEGSSWQRFSGHEGFVKHGNLVYESFLKNRVYFDNVHIKDKFIMPDNRKDIAICAIIKDENEYLEEWIKYHTLIGIRNFIIYDNDSKVPIKDTIVSFKNLDADIINVIEVKGLAQQYPSYVHCINNFKHKFKWIAFIDTDEFIVLKEKDNIYEFLKDYEKDNIGGFGINWKMFGSSGNIKKPKGLQIESFIKCINDKCDVVPGKGVNNHIKSIVRPEYVKNIITPHAFSYIKNYRAVNEIMIEIPESFSNHLSNKIQVNHYFTRSKEEFQNKINRGKADTIDTNDKRSMKDFYEYDNLCSDVDTSILRFVDKLKEKM